MILLTSTEPSAGITTLFPPQCPFLIEANKDQLKSLRAFLKRGLATKCISRLSVFLTIYYMSLSSLIVYALRCVRICGGRGISRDTSLNSNASFSKSCQPLHLRRALGLHYFCHIDNAEIRSTDVYKINAAPPVNTNAVNRSTKTCTFQPLYPPPPH